jgi:hypothetical protein
MPSCWCCATRSRCCGGRTPRPGLDWADRAVLAALARLLPAGGGFLAQTAADGGSYLEMVVPGPEDGVRHYWRERDAPVQSWTSPGERAQECGRVAAASIVQADDRNVEFLVQADGKLARYWREPSPSSPWHGPDWIADDVAGNPSAIRRDGGALVIPGGTAGVRYLYRDGGSWTAGGVFGQEHGRVDAVALAEGADGELAAVIRTGPLLACYRLSPREPWRWDGPEFVFRGAAGIPGLARNNYGEADGLEMLTPLPDGGLAHLWRDGEASDPGGGLPPTSAGGDHQWTPSACCRGTARAAPATSQLSPVRQGRHAGIGARTACAMSGCRYRSGRAGLPTGVPEVCVPCELRQ